MSKRTNNNNVVFATIGAGTKVHIINPQGGWYEDESFCGNITHQPVVGVKITDSNICKTCLKAARSKGVV